MFPHLTIDNDAHLVPADAYEVSLAPKEYAWLVVLATAPVQVMVLKQFFNNVCIYDVVGVLRTVYASVYL